MSGFTERHLIRKLLDLKEYPSQQSIETLSFWFIHHRRHCHVIVKIWMKEFLKIRKNLKLSFIYLANDVIQKCKRKAPQFKEEYGAILKKAFEHMSSINFKEGIKNSLIRVLHIWADRKIYHGNQIAEFKEAFETQIVNKINYQKEVNVEMNDVIEKHTRLCPQNPTNFPPKLEDLFRALQDLQNAASADATIQQDIKDLPSTVFNLSLLETLEDRKSIEMFSDQVDQALYLLTQYNDRLADEMMCRQRVSKMLMDFTQTQNKLLDQAKQKLVEYTEFVRKIHAVKEEVQYRLQNLSATYSRRQW